MSEIIQLKNKEIEYVLTGKKQSETILFLHGLGANLTQFQEQHTFFESHYKVLSVSLRGHGNSKITSRPTPVEFTLEKMAQDVIEVLQSLRIDQVHFVGNSMGGNVGYEILKSNPLVLKSFTTFGTTGQLITSTFTFKMLKFLYRILSTKVIGTLAKAAGKTKESKEKIKEMMSKTNKSILLSILPNIANFDYLDIIKSSSKPCMIIKGAHDKDINKAIASTINQFEQRGNFKLYEASDAGHFVNLDNPDLFNEKLEQFIQDNNKK